VENAKCTWIYWKLMHLYGQHSTILDVFTQSILIRDLLNLAWRNKIHAATKLREFVWMQKTQLHTRLDEYLYILHLHRPSKDICKMLQTQRNTIFAAILFPSFCNHYLPSSNRHRSTTDMVHRLQCYSWSHLLLQFMEFHLKNIVHLYS